jgi:diguanylate cyclase (GGDEF)-like protein
MRAIESTPWKNHKILIVEPDVDTCNKLTNLLSAQGHQIWQVQTQASAWQQVQQEMPHLVLLSTQLPDSDSFEFCQTLCSYEFTAHLPVIFLTTEGLHVDRDQLFLAGGSDYLVKPLVSQEVLSRINAHLATLHSFQPADRGPRSGLNSVKLVKLSKSRRIQTQRSCSNTPRSLLRSSHQDCLTRLPNRSWFLDHLGQTLKLTTQGTEPHFAVLRIDCDRFQRINNTYGHETGDQLLVAIAQRLKSCLRPTDRIARFGDDEFAVILKDVSTLRTAVAASERIHHHLLTPFHVDSKQIFVNTNIGVVIATQDYKTVEAILRDANVAANCAKASSTGYEVFMPGMQHQIGNTLQIETDLRLAIKRQEFSIHYQPIIALHNQEIKGFEALIRWHHPDKGVISPAEFIPVAEETGLIIPIGQWILRQACYQLRFWQRQHLVSAATTISINLSARQFSQPNLIEEIDRLLAETDLASQNLNLEITESALIENHEVASQILQQLRDRQIRLSIDDFGTGYSSLSYLHRFPANSLKIDRSFIRGITEDTKNLEIVRTIITLAQQLGMNVTAEGIETPEQLACLQQLECELGQGYFFHKPLPSQSIEQLLRDHQLFLTKS